MKRAAVIVQRYGSEVIGGAEHHARLLAEKLTTELDWQVDVFTTTARDYRSWEPYYPTGQTSLNGVCVTRFNPIRLRHPLFEIYNRLFCLLARAYKKIPFLKRIVLPLEKLWYRWQGPDCPDLLTGLKDKINEFDCVLCFTYLYQTSIDVVTHFPNRIHLIPTAHNEPAFYFQTTHKLLYHARSLMVNGEAEARLIKAIYPEFGAKIKIAGIGFDSLTDVPAWSDQTKSPMNCPYVLYLGRLGRAKNTDQLIRFFLEYCQLKSDHSLTLVLAGQKEDGFEIASSKQIHYCGPVNEDDKLALIDHASLVVNPSEHESLSLLVLEAVCRKRLVLVNRRSSVLASYEKELPTVYGYSSSQEFVDQLAGLLKQDHSDQLRAASEQACQWVQENYSWNRVLSVFEHCLS